MIIVTPWLQVDTGCPSRVSGAMTTSSACDDAACRIQLWLDRWHGRLYRPQLRGEELHLS